MSHSKHEAPRELVAVLWSIAGIFALFFAISFSSLFIIKTYFPVDAQAVTVNTNPIASSKCKAGEASVGINNYPGENAILAAFPKSNNTDYAHGKIEAALGGNYQCTNLCVPGLDTSKPANDQANVAKIREYLAGATSCGANVVIYDNGTSFMDFFKLNPGLKASLQASVVASSIKGKCAGSTTNIGNSKPYCEIVLKNKEKAKESEPNTTAKDAEQAAKKTEEETQKATTQKAANSTDDQPIAGAPLKEIKLPQADQVSKNNLAALATSGTDIDTCMTNINQFVYKYEELLKRIEENQRKESDPNITRFQEIKAAYIKLKEEPYKSNQDRQLTECHKIEAKATYLEEKLWGSKTALEVCKKQVKTFLADYGNKKVTEPAYTYYLKAKYWNSVLAYPYYKVSSERSMKLCKITLDWIHEYKIATDQLYGPTMPDSTQIYQNKLDILNKKIITYNVTGKAWWSLTGKKISNKAVVCVANTKDSSGTAGELTRIKADSQGNFAVPHKISGQMLGERGVAILIYDAGGGFARSRDLLYYLNASEFKSLVHNKLLNNTESSIVQAGLGNIDLEKGFGVSKSLRERFTSLTGRQCN